MAGKQPVCEPPRLSNGLAGKIRHRGPQNQKTGRLALSRSLWSKRKLFKLPLSMGGGVRRSGRARFASISRVAKVKKLRQLATVTLGVNLGTGFPNYQRAMRSGSCGATNLGMTRLNEFSWGKRFSAGLSDVRVSGGCRARPA